MKTFDIKKDITTIRKLFNLNETQFANEIGLSRSNIARYESKTIFPHNSALEKIYFYFYKNKFHLNKAKEMVFSDNKKIIYYCFMVLNMKLRTKLIANI